MRGAARMTGERFDSTERNRIARELQISQQVERRRFSTFQINRNKAARKVALLAIDALLFGIIEQGRIIYLRNFGMHCEPLGDALRVLALPVHAQANSG